VPLGAWAGPVRSATAAPGACDGALRALTPAGRSARGRGRPGEQRRMASGRELQGPAQPLRW
jgi:hypothetical protein